MAKIREFGAGFENLSAHEFIAHAKRAEDEGFGTFWVPEDYFYRGAFTLAAAVATGTSKIKIGIGVLNPYTRHPALTAMEFGALEELSGGRGILGIGTGVRDWIEQRLKIPFYRSTSAMRDSIEITRRMFRGEEVSYQGRALGIDKVKLSFKPPRTEIPIHLGVISPKNLELTGEAADGLLLSVMSSPAYVKFAVDHVTTGLRKSGRELKDFAVGTYILSSISENEREARDALKPFLAVLISIMAPQPHTPIFAAAGLPPETIQAFGASMARGVVPVDMVTDWMIDTFTIAGSPSRCRENMARLVEAGMNTPVFFEVPGVPPRKTMDDVRKHLIPHFSQLG